jgi:hypothetical protein
MFKRVMGFCKEGGFFLTLIIFLLFANLIATIMVADKTNIDLHFQEEAIKLVIEMGLKNKEDNDELRDNMYRGLSMIMSGQSQTVLNQHRLDKGLLRLHHFAEPHGEKFYPDCPECIKGKRLPAGSEAKITQR